MVLATVHGVARTRTVVGEAAAAVLRAVHDSLDLPGHRVELLEGRVIVGAAQVKLHNRIVTWLSDALREFCNAQGWDRFTIGTVDLAATCDRIQPDLFVSLADESTDGQWLVPAKDVLLVTEVVAASSRREDYEVKRLGCAQSEIPLYLVVDPGEALITLLAGPSPRGYLRATTIGFGDKLDLPEPFAITLDTATMPGRPLG